MSFGTGCNRRLAYSTKVRLFVSTFVTLFFFILIKDSILYDFYVTQEPVDARKALHWGGDPIAEGDAQWQRVDYLSEVFVYSAHYDDVGSSPLIRVIGIALDPLPYFYVKCRYFSRRDGSPVYSVYGELRHMRERNGRRYLGAFVECPLSEPVSILPYALTVDKGNNSERLNYLIINYSREVDTLITGDELQQHNADYYEGIEMRQNAAGVATQSSDWQWNVTRCFPAFQQEFDNHVMLAEVVAISRLLGVEHFVFYVQSATKEVLDMLEVLKSQGDTEVWPWNMNLGEEDLYYAGQFSSINDCLYRHLHTSRFLLFGDVDELFVPRDQGSLQTLLDRQFSEQPYCAAFLFLNVFFNLNFPPQLPDQLETTNTTRLEHIQRLEMLTHIQRHTEVLEPSDRSKPALDPRRVLIGSVHVVQAVRDGFESCVMNPHDGLLHHYRKYDVPSEENQVEDAYLWDLFDDIVVETKMIMDEYDEMTG